MNSTRPPEQWTAREYSLLPLEVARKLRRAWRQIAGPLATTPNGAPFPLREWPPDAAIDIQALAEWVDPLVPTGAIMSWAGSAAPAGWALCNGALLKRAEHPRLFQAIGVAYGIGDGATTFATPNLAGRVILGVSGSHALNTTGGAETHDHDLGTLGHAKVTLNTTNPGRTEIARVTVPSWNASHKAETTGSVSTGDTGMTTASSLGGTTNTANGMPPYLTLNYIIKL
jgi:microcystin-dependent protein